MDDLGEVEVLDCDPEVSQEWTLTDQLPDTPVGPDLARVLASTDRAGLDAGQLLELSRARMRMIAHLEAQLLADLDAVAGCPPTEDPEPDNTDRYPYPWAAVEAAMALRWRRNMRCLLGQALFRLDLAHQLINRLPVVFHALNEGLIDIPKALVIFKLLEDVDDQLAAALAAAVIDKAGEQTTGELRARLRRLLLAADALAAGDQARSKVRGRRVAAYPNENHLANLAGYDLAPDRVAAVMERLDAIAAAYRAAGDQRGMDQLRADAFLDLLTGEGVAAGGPLSDGGLGEGSSTDSPGPASHGSSATNDNLDRAEAAAAADGQVPWPDTPPPDVDTPPDTDPDRPDASEPAVPAEPDGLDGLWVFGRRDVPPHPDHDVTPLVGDSDHTHPAPGCDTERDWWLAHFDQLPTIRPATWCALCGHTTGTPAAAPGPMPAPRRGIVEITAPLSMLLGLSDLPAELVGFGPVLADIARQTIAGMSDAQWRYSLYNDLGELARHGTTTARPHPDPHGHGHETRRRPGARLTAYIRARDRTCVAPGCRRPARRCQIDHTLAWVKGGETVHCNLGCLCLMHHLFKHATGSVLTQLSPGTFAWETPAGRQYITRSERPLYDETELVGLPKP